MLYTGADPLGWPLVKKGNWAEVTAIFRQSLRDTLENLHNAGVFRVLVIQQYPKYNYEILRCFQRNPQLCNLERSKMDSYRNNISVAIKDIVADFPFARVVDPLPYFCDSSYCQQTFIENGKLYPVTSDDNHPAREASLYFGRKIARDLDWVSGANRLSPRFAF